jgi:sugar lactone lactonase YvrE
MIPHALLAAALVVCAMQPAAVESLRHVAGVCGASGFVDGATATARFRSPSDVALLGAVLIVSDAHAHRIRAIAGGVVTTLAGGSEEGFRDSRVGAEAMFKYPHGVAVVGDAGGTIFVADNANHAVRRVLYNGTTTTLSGGGIEGHKNGAAYSATFNNPFGVALSAAAPALLYVADTRNQVVRLINLTGAVAEVSTLAGVPYEKGHVDGAAASAKFWEPVGIAAYGVATLFVSDVFNNAIRKVHGGTVSTIAGDPSATGAGFRDGSGTEMRLRNPRGLAVSAAGDVLFIADTGNNAVRRFTGGALSTVVTQGLHTPTGVAAVGGDVVIADHSNFCVEAEARATTVEPAVPPGDGGGVSAVVVVIIVVCCVVIVVVAAVLIATRAKGRAREARYRVSEDADAVQYDDGGGGGGGTDLPPYTREERGGDVIPIGAQVERGSKVDPLGVEHGGSVTVQRRGSIDSLTGMPANLEVE